jgi:hypothetical protein
MTGVGWYSQQISLNFLNSVKFYICKPKSTGRGSLIKKQTISHLHHNCFLIFEQRLCSFSVKTGTYLNDFAKQYDPAQVFSPLNLEV